jgi:pSer/pThr/pTyr-binding forkhead associated (FHA) protein
VLDADASRIHAEIRRSADGHTIADVGSGNGTSVNGRRATEQHHLIDGDEIEIGTTRLTYRLD